MTAIARRLPFGLARIVPPSLVGFAVINGFTFTCDLALLTALHGGLHWPVPVGITVSYGTASGLSYLLNRTFNFHSHGAVGRQVPVYIAVVVVNYLAWILGVGAGLAALGVGYQIARGIAAVCEAVYMYTAMRWVVFRDATPEPEPQQPEPGAGRGQSGAGPGHDDVAVAVDHAVTRPEQ
jgi:putative flippase GtrA